MALWNSHKKDKVAEPVAQRDLGVRDTNPPAAPAQTQQTSPSEHARKAYIDTITPTIVTGWACDPADMGSRLTIETVATNGKRLIVVADLYRQDVMEAGYGDGFYGFEIDITKLALKTETFEIRFFDTKARITSEPLGVDPEQALLTHKMPAVFCELMQRAALDLSARHAELFDVGL